MARWRGPRKTAAPGGRRVRKWQERGQAPWLQGAPEDDARIRRRSGRVGRPAFDPGRPPEGLEVRPGTPDGWEIALVARRPRGSAPRWAVGLVLAGATAIAAVLEPLFAILPGFALLAFAYVLLFEETGPGTEEETVLAIGTAGVRCGALHLPSPAVRDVFWRTTQAGEAMLGVRGPDGDEHEVVRVPTAPAFANGLDDAQREWIAEALRRVGQANRARSGTVSDVPDVLKAQLERRRREKS